MPRMGKTDWNGLKLGLSKTVQPNSFSNLVPATCNFKNIMPRRHICLSRISDFVICMLFLCLQFKFHSDWGRVIDKIKQNELDCRDTAPLTSGISVFWFRKKNCLLELVRWCVTAGADYLAFLVPGHRWNEGDFNFKHLCFLCYFAWNFRIQINGKFKMILSTE